MVSCPFFHLYMFQDMAMCCALRSNLTVAEMANYRSGVKLLPEPHAVYNIFATSVVLTMFISSAERRKVDETAESCAGGRMNSLLKSLLHSPIYSLHHFLRQKHLECWVRWL